MLELEGNINLFGKMRLIDDFARFFVNDTVASSERVDVVGIDEVVALYRLWAAALLSPQKEYEIHLSDGEVLRGKVHPDWERSIALADPCFRVYTNDTQ